MPEFSFYRFWVIKGKPTLLPPKINLTKNLGVTHRTSGDVTGKRLRISQKIFFGLISMNFYTTLKTISRNVLFCFASLVKVLYKLYLNQGRNLWKIPWNKSKMIASGITLISSDLWNENYLCYLQETYLGYVHLWGLLLGIKLGAWIEVHQMAWPRGLLRENLPQQGFFVIIFAIFLQCFKNRNICCVWHFETIKTHLSTFELN